MDAQAGIIPEPPRMTVAVHEGHANRHVWLFIGQLRHLGFPPRVAISGNHAFVSDWNPRNSGPSLG
jgi:hypothetical protein